MKKRLAQNLLFFAINVIGFFIIYIIGTRFRVYSLNIIPVLIAAVVCVLIGSFIGLGIYLWREKEAAKAVSYTIGLVISSAAFFSLLVFMFFFNKPPKKSNAEQNLSDISFGFKNQHEKEAMIAYKALAKKCDGENNILLNGGSYVKKDSLLNGYSQAFYIFRLKYFIVGDSTLFVSKIMVHDTIPAFVFFNRIAARDAETKQRDSASRHQFLKTMEGIKSITTVDSIPAE